MKNLFSGKLYLEGLKKIKTAGIAAAITVIALNAMVPILYIIESNASWPGTIRMVTSVSVNAFAPFGLLMMVFAAVFAYSMFSFLNERNRADFWHAIPHKRLCVYLSLTAAICTWITAILVTSAVVNAILFAFAKYYTVSVSAVFLSTAVYMLVAFMLAAFMTLAMTLTGTTISNLLIMALLFLFVRVVGFIFVEALFGIAPMWDASYSAWRFLEIDFFLPFALLQNLFNSSGALAFSDIPLLVYSIFTWLLLLFLGAVGYRVRSSETATKSAPNRVLQHIYRCAITLPIFLFLTALIILEDNEPSTTVILLVVALVAWMIFELMTTKKFKNVLRSLPVLIVPVVISLLFAGVLIINRNAIWNTTPSPDEIQGISIVTARTYNRRTYEQLMTGNLVADSDEAKTIVADALEETIRLAKEEDRAYVYSSRHFVIHLKSGRTIGRYVTMDDKQYQEVRNALYSSEAYKEARLKMPSSKEISDISVGGLGSDKEIIKRIWVSFLYEYSCLGDEEKAIIKDYYSGEPIVAESYDSMGLVGKYQKYNVAGQIYVAGMVGVEHFQSTYPLIYQYMPVTTAMYLEAYNQVDQVFAPTAEGEIEGFYNLLCKCDDKEDVGAKGGVYFSVLCGDTSVDGLNFQFATDEALAKDEDIRALFDLLRSLEAPENFDAAPDKTIVFCHFDMELNGGLLLESLDEEELKYSPGNYYYYSRGIALALNRTEVQSLLAVCMTQTEN